LDLIEDFSNMNLARMKQLISKTVKPTALGMILALWAFAASAQPTANYNFTFPVNQTVPDGNASGLALTTNLTGMSGTITNVSISLDITGGFNGDLYVYLDGSNGGFAVLLNRVGVTGGDAFGYSDTGFNVTFDDSASYNNIHFYQNFAYTLNGGGQLTGSWSSDGRAIDPLSTPSTFATTQPTSLLDSFDGTDPNGTWSLFLTDLSGGGQSSLANWRLDIVAVPEPSACALLGIGILWLVWKRINRPI
jgi:subtilisin-like proprotein convertase family protein